MRRLASTAQLARRRVLAVAVLVALAGGSLGLGLWVGHNANGLPHVPEASVRQDLEHRTSFLARLIPPAPAPVGGRSGPGLPRSIADLAARLPLERKVAQLFLLGFRGQDLTAPIYEQLRRLDLGGIVIDRVNYLNAQRLGMQAGEALVISQQAKHVPPLVMADQQGGALNSFPDLPPADAPADINSTGQASSEASDSAHTLRALGVTGVFAPSLDMASADDPVFGTRSYSEDPREAAGWARATVSAYRAAGVLAAATHFPGLGSATQDTEDGPAQVGLSLNDLLHRDLVPFRAAFGAGLQAVELSHALYVMDNFTVPGSLSKQVVTDLLRKRLHFRGLAITDDLEDPPITAYSSVPDAAVQAVKAGADMVQISGPFSDQQAAYVAVLRAVERGEIPRRRLNEAVGRILTTKRALGLIR